jgi:1-acyl-sn-glycerol-3-phosphate acyltransferase
MTAGARLRGADWLRLAVRMPVYGAGTLALATAWFLAWPLGLVSMGVRRRMRRITLQGWARWSLLCFAIRLETHGTLPREGVLLVANHVSYVDIWVLAARVDAVFVSMRELLGWPFFGRMARSVGTVFLDRDRKREIVGANQEMARWIERGYTVVLFPEGEHSHGEEVRRFRPALLQAAVAARLPVACATIGYRTAEGDPPASSVVAWVREPFPGHAARLASRRRIDARLVFHAELETALDRKDLAERLRARVASAFVPLTRTPSAGTGARES